jgi:hypothetical protein
VIRSNNVSFGGFNVTFNIIVSSILIL